MQKNKIVIIYYHSVGIYEIFVTFVLVKMIVDR